MKIFQIVANRFYNTNPVQTPHPQKTHSNIFLTNPIPFDTVSFTASRASGAPLKKLAEFGIPDMYTGKEMMPYGALSRLLKNGVFSMPLNKLLPILNKYNDTLHDTEQKVVNLLKGVEKKHPDLKINEAFQKLFPEQQKRLLNIQRPVFQEITKKACDMPRSFYDDFIDLMRYTNKKIAKDPTISHFSEKEFIYRLEQVAKQIKMTRRHTEVSAINRLIREAKILFRDQIEEKKKFGRGIAAKKLKMEFQMQPAVLKQNTQNIQYLRELFEKSYIKNNKEIRNIFDVTSAKIYGFPTFEPFKRQEFIYDLKNIVKFLKDKELETEIIQIARELPTSANEVSAFIVKHVNDTPERIGYYLFKGSLASIEHIDPKVPLVKEEPVITIGKKKKKKAKNNSTVTQKNHINNYGLSSAYINSMRSNMPFDEWIRKNPQGYSSCQKFVDRLIELYKTGKFAQAGLDRSYITNFAEKIRKVSPDEKPIILDLSKLYG